MPYPSLHHPQDNRDMATINASISGTTLHISRREEMSGALKEHFQPYLIMDEDLYNSVRRQLGITATIYDETKEKFHADLRESYRREREQEKERYHNEIIGYHGSEEGLETLLGYQLFSIGNRADSAALVYQVDYVLDGYVKKAGTNFVLRRSVDRVTARAERRTTPAQGGHLLGDAPLLPMGHHSQSAGRLSNFSRRPGKTERKSRKRLRRFHCPSHH